MAEDEDVLLSLDEAYRAAYRFIAQYYAREPIAPFMLMLRSMAFDAGDGKPNDPASWQDWIECVQAARATTELPVVGPPRDSR